MDLGKLFRNKRAQVVALLIVCGALGVVILILVISRRSSEQQVTTPVTEGDPHTPSSASSGKKPVGGKVSTKRTLSRSNNPGERVEEVIDEEGKSEVSPDDTASSQTERTPGAEGSAPVVKPGTNQNKPLLSEPQKGKESLNELVEKSQLPPISSYLDVAKPVGKFLSIEDVKDLPEADLMKRKAKFEKEMKGSRKNSVDWYTNAANILLLATLSLQEWEPNVAVFKAWKNTGFKTVGCPEFATWLENSTSKPSNRANILTDLIGMYHDKSCALLGVDAEASQNNAIQDYMARLAYDAFGYAQSGSVYSQRLLQFLKTGLLADAKKFMESLAESSDKAAGNHLSALNSPFSLFVVKGPIYSEAGFASNLIRLSAALHSATKNLSAAQVDAVKPFEECGTPQEAFQLWTTHGKARTTALNSMTKKYYIEYLIEVLQQEYDSFKETGKYEKVKFDYSKSKYGRLMAIRAYISMRELLASVDISDLTQRGKKYFGFEELPSDRSVLNVDTFLKNPSSDIIFILAGSGIRGHMEEL